MALELVFYIYIYALWMYFEFGIQDNATNDADSKLQNNYVILLIVFYFVSVIKAIMDLTFFISSYRIVSLFASSLFPQRSWRVMLCFYFGYFMGGLLLLVGKLFKETVIRINKMELIFQAMGMDSARSLHTISVMEDVEENV